jgi:solute:Na+ symporter, SSS family
LNMLGIDWVILVVFLGILVFSALISRKLTKSVAQFTVAGRSMGMWLGLSSGNAEAMGLISIAALCQQGFIHGFAYIWLGVFMLLILHIPIFGILGLGIQRYRATKVQTLPQYFEMRYSRGIRLFAGIVLAVGGVLNMAIFPAVESQLLIAFIGIPETVSIMGLTLSSFHVILFILLFLALFFTVIGGMVSVVITDYVQSVIMFVGITVATYLVIDKVGLGGIKNAIESNLDDAAFNPFLGQSLGVVFIVSVFITTFLMRLSFAPHLQRFASAKNEKVVRQMYLLSNVFAHGRIMMISVWGIAALALFGAVVPVGQNPEAYQRIVGGLVLAEVMPPVIMGIVLAGFLFASISTNDSYILSWSSIITNDIICAFRKKAFTHKQHILVLRLTCLGVAVFLFLFGLWYDPKESIVQYMYLTATIFCGCGIISWFGLYWKRANTAGAWCALILALVMPIVWLSINQLAPGWIPKNSGIINNDNVTLFCLIVPSLMLVIISLCSSKKTGYVDYGKRLKEIQECEQALKKELEETTV